MAIKTLVIPIECTCTGEGLIFKLDISNCEAPHQVAQNHEYNSGLSHDAADLTINSAIANYIKSWAGTNWGTTYGLLDNVRIMQRIDGSIL